MENQILEALYEMKADLQVDVADAVKEWGARELFDIWLKYEGGSNSGTQILAVLTTLGIIAE